MHILAAFIVSFMIDSEIFFPFGTRFGLFVYNSSLCHLVGVNEQYACLDDTLFIHICQSLNTF